MAKKRTAFQDAIEGAAGRVASGASPAAGAAGGSRKDARAHRVGRVNVTGYFDPAVKSSFRAIQTSFPERTLQELLEEALNDLFAKYNVPQSAKLHHREGE